MNTTQNQRIARLTLNQLKFWDVFTFVVALLWTFSRVAAFFLGFSRKDLAFSHARPACMSASPLLEIFPVCSLSIVQ